MPRQGELLPHGGTRGGGQGGHGGGHSQAGGEERRSELGRELSHWRIEAGKGKGAVGGSGLEDIGGQDGVSAGPGHLLPLVLHPTVLEPNLEITLAQKFWSGADSLTLIVFSGRFNSFASSHLFGLLM